MSSNINEMADAQHSKRLRQQCTHIEIGSSGRADSGDVPEKTLPMLTGKGRGAIGAVAQGPELILKQ
jgi:hypothetical protein